MYYNIRRFVEPVIPTRKQLCKAARRHIVLEDLSADDKCSAGFRILYPSDLLEKHGIGQADWVRFLEDLGMAARLAGQGLSAVGSRVPVTPLPTRGIFSSRASGVAYDSQFVRTPKDEVQALITVWNQSAFERRKLRVSMHPKGDGGAKTGWELLVESL
ncbi:hypothetical protein SERLA73DRAFT_163306 [Serpula lacrymans var. lacrymans S7.3]|uniref:Uncharacterized protein n=1 Tax=Serpula lacrymans var. lacrymans (strain S7.3) TaxID=936435 RepID=F8QCQ5_SERL3|nr:hypothetical protein SERLA73DRAFT_163306 [Serpula lacrymans var. lacrymans S7.3]